MKGFLESTSKFRSLELKRAEHALQIKCMDVLPDELRPDGAQLWMSNGGGTRVHPAKSLPFSLEIGIEDLPGPPVRLEMIGAFARFASSTLEPAGTIGATVQIVNDDQLAFRQDLIQGRHYSDAAQLEPVDRVNGDGTSVTTVGSVEIDGATYRLDRLTIDLPPLDRGQSLVFRDLGSPASFALLGAHVEFATPPGCPFHSKSGLISLREVSAIIRVGDRRRFTRALEQLAAGIHVAADLDEARGQALTFLAVVTAGMLESGGSRELHRVQLEAARALEELETVTEIAGKIVELCERTTEPLFSIPDTPSAHLMDRALSIVDRNFAKDLSDSAIAEQLGLSTSHFRFLFKQATGSPFHKYVIAVRLEKARMMLLEQGLPVSQVAAAVGFTGLSHFSRAFTQRFSASPTNLRRQGG
jgi:AraC-like DNA-binding protein